MNGPASVTANFAAAGPGWYNSAWTNRRKITINHAKISGGADLTNFPMLVSVTDVELKTVGNGGKVGRSDGTDILFTAGDGTTKLNHELESYSPTAGSAAAWVRIPGVSASVDTVIYVYYGNAGAADQQNKTGVWDSNYKVVNHLKDAAGTVTDSTQYGNHGTASGGAAFTANGMAGGGYKFHGIKPSGRDPDSTKCERSVTQQNMGISVTARAR